MRIAGRHPHVHQGRTHETEMSDTNFEKGKVKDRHHTYKLPSEVEAICLCQGQQAHPLVVSL